MRLVSKVQPPFFPDPDQDSVLHLGLQSLNPATWIQRDADLRQFQQHKRRVFRDYSDKVYFALPGSEAAQAEFHQCLIQHLVADHNASDLAATPFVSLWQSSLLVQEDICLLEPKGERYLLTAASVCSPSNWKLEEKVGRDVDFIHQPVPDYAEVLSTRVNRLFNKLKPEAPLLRYNWSLQDSNELFWRADLQNPSSTTQPLWCWRVERQTLQRLPRSQCIVFTIRIYLRELEKLDQHTDIAERLRAIVRRLPDNQRQYKGLQRWLQQWPS